MEYNGEMIHGNETENMNKGEVLSYKDMDGCIGYMGKWFWTEGWHKEDDEKAKLVLFRAAFNGKPDNTRIRITADTRYKLYVNGVHVQSGQ